MAQPTAFEQLTLELINRFRIDPDGEFARLVTAGQNNVLNALEAFGVDRTALQTALNALTAVAPLAWSESLADAARAHTQRMIDADEQSHQLPGEPDLGARATAAGYNWNGLAENVYAFASDAIYGHAGFVIDWGYDAEDFNSAGERLPDYRTRGDGVQDPPGHRNNLISSSFTEIGIGVIEETNSATDVGRYVITQDLGRRAGYAPQVLGVVISDADSDSFYDIGEGLGGVTVRLTGAGGTFTTTSWTSGGYQLSAPAGSYQITFSGGGLAGTVTKTVTLGSSNIKVDTFAAEAGVTLPPGFDALQYIASYDDLIRAFGTDETAGEEHYRQSGYFEGRSADAFDTLRYIASYDDLIRAFGTDEDAATRHFLTSGFAEGRSRHAFDPMEYVASYDDLLRAFGSDAAAATDHFITLGSREGRSRDAFDAVQYLASYDDLLRAFGSDQAAATGHFVANGFGEGRARDTFDALQYLASHDDLVRAFGDNEAAGPSHFVSSGFWEGRARDTFDAARYLANYADLRAAFGEDETAATRHYLQHGFFEGRTDNAPPPAHLAYEADVNAFA